MDAIAIGFICIGVIWVIGILSIGITPHIMSAFEKWMDVHFPGWAGSSSSYSHHSGGSSCDDSYSDTYSEDNTHKTNGSDPIGNANEYSRLIKEASERRAISQEQDRIRAEAYKKSQSEKKEAYEKQLALERKREDERRNGRK